MIFQKLTLVLVSATALSSLAQGSAEGCGEVATLKTHGDTTMRFALSHPKGAPALDGPVALVLLPGGGGHLNLEEKGCPRSLAGIARFVRGGSY